MDYSNCFSFSNYLWISLTQKCQWRCTYCDHPSIVNPVTCTEEQLLSVITMLNNLQEYRKNTEILLEGGEIGLIDSNILDLIFNSNVSDKYSITTNGLFMKNGFHKQYEDKIRYILYHVMPEIENKSFEYYNDTSIPIQYTVVVHKQNIQQFATLLDNNPNCMFLPHFLQPRRTDLNFMNEQDFITIYNIIKDRNNVFDFIKLRLKFIIKLLNKKQFVNNLQLKCQQIMTKTMINIPTNSIHRCCVSMQSSKIELTEVNLKNILQNTNIFPNTDTEMCLNCISSNVFMDLYSGQNYSFYCKILNI
jgi:Molybdenum cofactor biosynthesis enzyme